MAALALVAHHESTRWSNSASPRANCMPCRSRRRRSRGGCAAAANAGVSIAVVSFHRSCACVCDSRNQPSFGSRALRTSGEVQTTGWPCIFHYLQKRNTGQRSRTVVTSHSSSARAREDEAPSCDAARSSAKCAARRSNVANAWPHRAPEGVWCVMSPAKTRAEATREVQSPELW